MQPSSNTDGSREKIGTHLRNTYHLMHRRDRIQTSIPRRNLRYAPKSISQRKRMNGVRRAYWVEHTKSPPLDFTPGSFLTRHWISTQPSKVRLNSLEGGGDEKRPCSADLISLRERCKSVENGSGDEVCSRME